MTIRNGKDFLVPFQNLMPRWSFLHYFAYDISSAHKMWQKKIKHLKRGNLMEHINRIELQGRVGTIRTNIVGDNTVANFSLVTEYLYKTRDGGAANETTWHQVTAWEGREMPDLRNITKGNILNVTGRLRTFKYTNAEGVEKQLYEVIASRIRILSEEEAV